MRALIRRLVGPYLQPVVRELREREREELAAVKKDLLATNHRITWLEEKLSALENADERR